MLLVRNIFNINLTKTNQTDFRGGGGKDFFFFFFFFPLNFGANCNSSKSQRRRV